MRREEVRLQRRMAACLDSIEKTLSVAALSNRLDGVLATAELLRGTGNCELDRAADDAIDRTARLVMTRAATDLGMNASRETAALWWSVGRKLAALGYALPDSFESVVIERAHLVFLRRVVDGLRADTVASMRSSGPFTAFRPRLATSEGVRTGGWA